MSAPITFELPRSIITTDQAERITELASSLDHEQAVWLSGYFAGLSHQARAAVIAPAHDAGAPPPAIASTTRTLTVLFGTETGNSKDLAAAMGDAAKAHGVEPRVVDMADYKPRALKEEQDLLVITSTHGEGDPPETALDFFEFLEGRKAPKLPDLRFAVLALGDSTYEHYCLAGRRVDERLASLGAQRLADPVECDVDYEDAAAAWIASVVDGLAPSENAPPAAPAARNGATPHATVDKRHPFLAEVLENIVLTGRGSSKETRHVELSLADCGLTYRPGRRPGRRAAQRPGARRHAAGPARAVGGRAGDGQAGDDEPR